MEQFLTAQTANSQVALQDIASQEFREKLQNFVNKLNTEPNQSELQATPDGKAKSLPISFVEMTLDEYFFGLWSTEGFKWSVIANEIVGSIDLIVTNPVSGAQIRRVGAASIQIMVDKGTDPLNVNNKKANALDMGFPKLKAECTKNAAQSLGKLLGRDVNRKHADTFNGLIKPQAPPADQLRALFEEKKHKLTEEDMINGYRILDNNETNSFFKLYKYLQGL